MFLCSTYSIKRDNSISYITRELSSEISFFYEIFSSISFSFFPGFPGSLTMKLSNDILGLFPLFGYDFYVYCYFGFYYLGFEVLIFKPLSFCFLFSTNDWPLLKMIFLVELVLVYLLVVSYTFFYYFIRDDFL